MTTFKLTGVFAFIEDLVRHGMKPEDVHVRAVKETTSTGVELHVTSRQICMRTRLAGLGGGGDWVTLNITELSDHLANGEICADCARPGLEFQLTTLSNEEAKDLGWKSANPLGVILVSGASSRDLAGMAIMLDLPESPSSAEEILSARQQGLWGLQVSKAIRETVDGFSPELLTKVKEKAERLLAAAADASRSSAAIEEHRRKLAEQHVKKKFGGADGELIIAGLGKDFLKGAAESLLASESYVLVKYQDLTDGFNRLGRDLLLHAAMIAHIDPFSKWQQIPVLYFSVTKEASKKKIAEKHHLIIDEPMDADQLETFKVFAEDAETSGSRFNLKSIYQSAILV